jgi:hypothetical protein
MGRPHLSPRITRRAGRGVSLRAGSELTVEFGDQRAVGGKEQLRASTGEHRVVGDWRTKDREGRRNPRVPVAGRTIVIEAADATSIAYHIE